MTDAAPTTIYLKDYAPFGYTIDQVDLTFDLAPSATRVRSRVQFRPNPATSDRRFFLHGEKLKLISAKIDGEAVKVREVEGGIECDAPSIPFVWEAEVQIDPAANTALEGLYLSNGMYCTQCEAEGFRRITYYPDRPDVMATFNVRVNGPHPVLLSNGNPIASGDGWAEWHDPWPKPAYLFALVAGDLVAHKDSFTTIEGRHVDLALWVRPEDAGKCAFGMEALKKSMTWDENVYGRGYDLDVF
ncbi:MAG: aminopeptidase N, partial [Rhodobacteraceae bacterium]|nr:aminopeptidase N [Paracoccaceae bacterium]